ncbi:Hydrophobin-2 [Dactylellina cionopaga]|nr:Hydrophobin-2 [Dactylellina cionopaga]
MQFLMMVTMLFANALAFPLHPRASVCPTGLNSNPQCCSVDVVGVADLDCETPDAAFLCPGKELMCCAIPVADQALLCVKAVSMAGGSA